MSVSSICQETERLADNVAESENFPSVDNSNPTEMQLAGIRSNLESNAEPDTATNVHLGKIRHVVITGGEPMLPREMEDLCQSLKMADFHITIETAGTIFRQLPCDLMSISPKFSNSTPSQERAGRWRERHERTRYQPETVRSLIANYDFQLKFVVDSPTDIEEVTAYLEATKYPSSAMNRVLLMPQGIDQPQLQQKSQWLKPLCRQWGFTYCPRRHIEWYGNRRGT